MSSHQRMRDRTVKILQYGCQMLVGYYGDSLNQGLKQALVLTRAAASNARKVFWMLKPIFHLQDCLTLLPSAVSYLQKIDLFEAFIWLLYYLFENLILLARLKIKYCYECNFDFPCNFFWFIGDSAFLITTSYRLFEVIDQYISCRSALTIQEGKENTEKKKDLLTHLEEIKLQLVDRSMALIIVNTYFFYHSFYCI